jgi:hypothetical protein
MARKLKTKNGQAVYARRKVIVEPVFGQMQTVHDAKGTFPTRSPNRTVAAHDRSRPGLTTALDHDRPRRSAIRRRVSDPRS